MSAIELAKYVEQRMTTLNLSITTAAERSGISRQTWHKLKRAEIQEAKISTLIGVARTLKTTVPELLNIYFHANDRVSSLMRHDNSHASSHWIAL